MVTLHSHTIEKHWTTRAYRSLNRVAVKLKEESPWSEGDMRIIRLLLENGADPNDDQYKALSSQNFSRSR